MNAHLLTLADLHAAAPGVLDVVFGPDGDFQGAPEWRCPIWGSVTRWGEDRPSSFVARWTRSGADFVTLEWDGNASVRSPSLDLRTSAADRVAKLCARVCLKYIGVTEAPVSVYVYDDWERCGLEVHTSGTDRYRLRNFCWDGRDGGGNDHFIGGEKRELFQLSVEVVARPQPDPISFLAALTLTLAPRIAALKDTP